MRIAIDARSINWTGIGRYTRNLLKGLARRDASHNYVVLIGKERLADLEELVGNASARFIPQLVDSSYYSWREQLLFLYQLQRTKADLVHFTHFNVPLLWRRPYLVTIHDITRFIFPGQRQQSLIQQAAYELVFKKSIEQAAGVICVSQTTRDELATLPIRLPASVAVIYEGVEEIFFEPPSADSVHRLRQLLKTDRPYLLFVGLWMSHKNIERLLEAYAIIRQQFPELALVITGVTQPGYVNVPRLVAQHQLTPHVVLPGFVDHALLPALYHEATCFIFPSLYEGFGLPPLEAAAAGTPVVASAVSSVPEIMREAALYCNPEYTPDIVRTLQVVLTQPAVRQQLVTKGRQRAQEFTWDCTVELTLQQYDQFERMMKRRVYYK
jgi:glycosyltransferase involved in cell wall biosynthesis